MEETTHDILKECCRDECSYQKLKERYTTLEKQANRYKQYLGLLEQTIRNDYESIMITGPHLEESGPLIVYVNDGFTRLTGYSREEAVGKSPRILQGEKTDRDILVKQKRHLKEGRSFFGQTVNYRKDGSEFVNQWDIHPLTDEEGNVTHWVSYQHDISERKRSEKILLDAEVEFDNLQEEAESTIVDLDRYGNIISANSSFRTLVRYELEELRQFRIWDLLAGLPADFIRRKFDDFDPDEFTDRDYDLTLHTQKNEEIEILAKTRLLGSNGQSIIRMQVSNRSLQKRIAGMLRSRINGSDRIPGRNSLIRAGKKG